MKFKEALEYYDKSLKITHDIGDRAGEADTLHQIGKVYQLTKQFDEALEYYDKSLKIAHEIGDAVGERVNLVAIEELKEVAQK